MEVLTSRITNVQCLTFMMSLQCVIVVLLGITNVEEFSLLVEEQKEVEKTGTLKRVCIHEQVMRYF